MWVYVLQGFLQSANVLMKLRYGGFVVLLARLDAATNDLIMCILLNQE